MDMEAEYDKLPPTKKERLQNRADNDDEFRDDDIEIQDPELLRELEPLFSPDITDVLEVDEEITKNVESETAKVDKKVDKRVNRNIDRRNRREAVKKKRVRLVEKIIQKLATSPEEVVDQVGEILRSGSVVRNFKGKNLGKYAGTVPPQTGEVNGTREVEDMSEDMEDEIAETSRD
jgi:hypothetical protein